MRTLILDNYDSFTYNLYQYIAELGGNPEVFRNNEISLREIDKRGYTHIVISPGPGSPDKKRDFGICADVIKKYAGHLPILGVCLGHQGIIHVLGGRVIRAPLPVHGKRSSIRIDTKNPLFKGLPERIEGMRYHSLIGEKASLPRELKIIGETVDDGLIMAVMHKTKPLFGVQFHPESVGTETGKQILRNFLAVGTFNDLTEDEAEKLLIKIAGGKFSEAEMVSILVDLARKGESVSEIVGMARGMRKLSIKLPLPAKTIVTDTCGTGGSGLPRMNISTTAAFVLAACGVKIAKHGNRASSGRSGSFDLLEALGVNIELPPGAVASLIAEVGIGFIFAPMFHPAMKLIAPVRRKIGTRTVFNLLGPLTNPAMPKFHLLGTTSTETAEKLIEAMNCLNYTHAAVVVGDDGLDDVTLTGKTHVYELNRGKIIKYDFSPEDVGMKRVTSFKHIAGGSPRKNADFFLKLIKGKGPKALQHLLELNAGFGLMISEIVPTVAAGIALARHAIKSGAVYEKFLAYKTAANNFSAFHRAIRGKNSIKIIAEIKRRSPSFGKFPAHAVPKLVQAYEKGGASAFSVVTDSKHFGGSIELLKQMRRATTLPIIRKDFITTEKQLVLTAQAGANAVLLIARMLPSKKLATLAHFANQQGLDVVVELHTLSDMPKIKGLKNIIVGINNRDLLTHQTDVNHAQKLLAHIDPAATVIIESGFCKASELKKYRGKADAALIGTTLLTAKNPEKMLKEFTHMSLRGGRGPTKQTRTRLLR